MNYPNYGAALRRARLEAGVSQAQLARDLGVSRAMVRYLERGERNPEQYAVRLEVLLRWPLWSCQGVALIDDYHKHLASQWGE